MDVSNIKSDLNYSGIISINNINLDLVNIENTKLDGILFSSAESLIDLLFAGTIKTSPINENNSYTQINSAIDINYSKLLKSDLIYKKDNVKVSIDEIEYSITDDYLESNLDFELLTKSNKKEYKTNLDLSIKLNMLQSSTIFDSIYDTYLGARENFSANFLINSLNIDNEYKIIIRKKFKIIRR